MNNTKVSKFFTAGRIRFARLSRNEIKKALLTSLIAFLLGICPLPFSVRPLGISFVCAAAENAPFAFIGLIAAAFFTDLPPLVYVISSLFAITARIPVKLFLDNTKSSPTDGEKSLNLFSEALPLRAACAAVSAFVLSLYPIITGGFRYYDLFGAIFSIGVSALAVPLFFGVFESNVPQKTRWSKIYKSVSELAVAGAACLSLTLFPLNGFEPALALAFILTLDFCLSHGLVEACACAIICGPVCGFENIPVLIISAFTAFCIFDVSPSLAAAVACISGSVCGIMISGSTYMTSPFLSLLSGCAVFATIKKLSLFQSPQSRAANTQAPAPTSSLRLECTKSLINNAQVLLNKLSAEFSDFSHARQFVEVLQREAAFDTEENSPLQKTLQRRFFELGLGKPRIYVFGKRNTKIIIQGERIGDKAEKLEFIRRQAEEISGLKLVKASAAGDDRALVLVREPAISYHHAIIQSERESPCGDTALCFYDKQRNFLYGLICDGMGSGKEANGISSKAASLLESLLLSGYEPQEALFTLSKLLSEQSPKNEISTTVDLMRIDTYTGEGRFFKCGAAPGYIKRGNEVIRLSSRTVPVGILSFTDCEEISFSAKENDLIIMASDGVAECESDGAPIIEYLKTHRTSSPKEIGEDIAALARKQGKKDDISVIPIKIFPQNY